MRTPTQTEVDILTKIGAYQIALAYEVFAALEAGDHEKYAAVYETFSNHTDYFVQKVEAAYGYQVVAIADPSLN